MKLLLFDELLEAEVLWELLRGSECLEEEEEEEEGFFWEKLLISGGGFEDEHDE